MTMRTKLAAATGCLILSISIAMLAFLLFPWLAGADVPVLRGHKNYISSLAFSPDGTLLASGGFEPEVRIWDVSSATLKSVLSDRPGYVNSIAFSHDGKLFAVASDEARKVENNPDGKLFGILGSDVHNPSQVKVYTVPAFREEHQTFREKFQIRGQSEAVCAVHFPAQGREAWTFSPDFELKSWDLKTGKANQSIQVQEKGARIEVGGGTGLIAFSSDGKTAIFPRGNDVIIFCLLTGTVKKRLKGHATVVVSVAVKPGCELAASLDHAGTTIIWDLTRNSIVTSLSRQVGQGHAIQFSPTNSVLAIVTSPMPMGPLSFIQPRGGLALWDFANGKIVREYDCHPGGVYCVAFSPNGKMVATGGADANIMLWRVPEMP